MCTFLVAILHYVLMRCQYAVINVRLAQARPNNGSVRQHMKHKQMGAGLPSVQSSPAIGCTVETRNLFVLDGKLVVIGDLPQLNVSLGVIFCVLKLMTIA